MRGSEDDVCAQMRPWTTTVNYSDDEILQDSALIVDDAAPRRKSADYGRPSCFAPYARLDVDHRPLDADQQVDGRFQTLYDYRSIIDAASSHVDDRDRFPRRTTCDTARDDDAVLLSRDSVPRDDDDVTRMRSSRRRFIDERLVHYATSPSTCASSDAGLQSITPFVRSISDHNEFVVCRRDTDRSSSATSSSSSSSPATRLLGRLAPQSSPPVTDVVPPSQRLPPLSVRARKRDQSTRFAAAGRLRRSNSVAGSSGGRSLSNGDEGFADGRTRTTPEPRRLSGSEDHVSQTRCPYQEENCGHVMSMSDQARKRSYRVGLNLFNK